ncbi:hypothetical protein [Mycobacterium sp. C31M]
MADVTERQALADLTADKGWDRRVSDRVDIYMRGTTRIRVIWAGDDALTGSSRYQDDLMETYTRELDTLKGWLSR